MPGLVLPKFYPILDTRIMSGCGLSAEDSAKVLLDAGVRILQLRHKGHFSRGVFEGAEQTARLCAEAGALFVINDRADMAAMLGAALHIGQDDLSPVDGRKLLPSPRVIGFSTHSEEQLRAAETEPVDYVALGPVFATGSKDNPDAVVGVTELQRLRLLTIRPLVAIGGITRDRAEEVLTAGADSVAVIGALFGPNCTYGQLRARAVDWLRLAS